MNVMSPLSQQAGCTYEMSGGPETGSGGMSGGSVGEDLMTRRQVALLLRVTSSAVATWARRGRLREVRDEAGRPRYRRADVEALSRPAPDAGSRPGGGPDDPDWPCPPQQ
jgi:hypothetical protein